MPFFPKLPTMMDFMTIANLHLKFSSINKLLDGRRIADGFQSLYSGQIPNHARIFVDEVAQDTVKADTDLNNILRKIIVEEMIAPFAHQMGVNAADVIHPLIRNAGLWVSVKDLGTFLRHCITKAAMTKALTHARDTNRLDQVKILVDINHLFFDNCSEITFLDFKLIGTTPFAAPAAPPAPPTVADIATAVATAIQTNSPQPKDLGNAIVATLGTAGLIGGAGGGGRGGGAPPSGCTAAPLPSLYTFNSAGLPPDVALHFQSKSDHKLISKTTLSTPFSTGYMYFMQGTHRPQPPSGGIPSWWVPLQ
jgi:hypothetical protein